MTPKSSIVSPSIQNPKLQKPTSNPFKLLSNPTPPKAYCFLWRRQDRRRLLLASLRSAQRRRDWSVARELRAYGFDGCRGSGLSKGCRVWGRRSVSEHLVEGRRLPKTRYCTPRESGCNPRLTSKTPNSKQFSMLHLAEACPADPERLLAFRARPKCRAMMVALFSMFVVTEHITSFFVTLLTSHPARSSP